MPSYSFYEIIISIVIFEIIENIALSFILIKDIIELEQSSVVIFPAKIWKTLHISIELIVLQICFKISHLCAQISHICSALTPLCLDLTHLFRSYTCVQI